MIQFNHLGKPIAKNRPRFANGVVYDSQNKEKLKMKWDFADQFRSQGFLSTLEGPIIATVDIRHPIPKSWSKKRKVSVLTGNDKFVTTKPDIDNICKWYFDVLNQIAYNDDSQIVSLTSKKTYSNNPGVEITLFRMEDKLINEHAITYKDKLTLEDLNYIIKKANRLGLNDRQLMSVHQEEDSEGTHVFFAVDSLKERTNERS